MRGAVRRPIDQTGVVGGGLGLVLAGALATLVVRSDSTLAFLLIAPIWLVLYPVSALIGYDLGTRGGGGHDRLLLRLGDYSIAVAAAHAAMAGAVAVLAIADIDGDSRVWYALYASCAAPAIPARAVALRVGREFHVPPGALLGASAVLVLLAWFVSFIVLAAATAGIDS